LEATLLKVNNSFNVDELSKFAKEHRKLRLNIRPETKGKAFISGSNTCLNERFIEKASSSTAKDEVTNHCNTVRTKVTSPCYTVRARVTNHCYTVCVPGLPIHCYTVRTRVTNHCYTVRTRVTNHCYTVHTQVTNHCYTMRTLVTYHCYSVHTQVTNPLLYCAYPCYQPLLCCAYMGYNHCYTLWQDTKVAYFRELSGKVLCFKVL
ncbi:unnamed protein product, partial [Ranitomeya imitator]